MQASSFSSPAAAVVPRSLALPRKGAYGLESTFQNDGSSSEWSPLYSNFIRARRDCLVPHALPETAASIIGAAVAVGAAATLLRRTTKTSGEDLSLRACEDCSGSGLCSECNGEGFVLRKQSDESAEKARMTAKNVATRYTAGLPKKWTYCSKCNSARNCVVCKGSGKINT